MIPRSFLRSGSGRKAESTAVSLELQRGIPAMTSRGQEAEGGLSGGLENPDSRCDLMMPMFCCGADCGCDSCSTGQAGAGESDLVLAEGRIGWEVECQKLLPAAS